MFLQVDGSERVQGHSYTNDAEAKTVLKLLMGFLKAGQVSPQEIGVISPYN